jgi:hypothetical protein
VPLSLPLRDACLGQIRQRPSDSVSQCSLDTARQQFLSFSIREKELVRHRRFHCRNAAILTIPKQSNKRQHHRLVIRNWHKGRYPLRLASLNSDACRTRRKGGARRRYCRRPADASECMGFAGITDEFRFPAIVVGRSADRQRVIAIYLAVNALFTVVRWSGQLVPPRYPGGSRQGERWREATRRLVTALHSSSGAASAPPRRRRHLMRNSKPPIVCVPSPETIRL